MQIGMRWQEPELEAIDAWARANDTSRPEAIRRLVEAGLKPHAFCLSDEKAAEISAWAKANGLSLHEAIARLVEIGLSVDEPQAKTSAKTSARAKEMAGSAIDKLSDPQASTEEKASRKRRLISGPEEFRDARVDRAKKK
jgi:hypothetical protein